MKDKANGNSKARVKGEGGKVKGIDKAMTREKDNREGEG